MAFGFEDLLPQGAAAQAAGEGANKIIDDYARREMDNTKLNEALVKADMDRKIELMTLPTKIMTQNLQNAQKLNLLEPEPTDEHINRVMKELFPDTKVSQLNDSQLAIVDAQAKALAKAEQPKLDPFDPTAWMKEVGGNAVSDLQGDIIKKEKEAAAMLERERVKQYAVALQKQLDRQHDTEKTGFLEEGRNNRKDKDLKGSMARKVVGEQGMYGRQSLKEAQDMYQGMKTEWSKKRFHSRKEKQAFVDGLAGIGNPEVQQRAIHEFADVIKAAGTPTTTPPAGFGNNMPNTKVIGGFTYEKRADGQWHKVKR